MNPLPKDMTTETPLTDQKWIWGTGMDGSPIEVVSADFARRLEMDRARLKEAFRYLSISTSQGGQWAHRAVKSFVDTALSELERNEK
jgi:hypothetical protein